MVNAGYTWIELFNADPWQWGPIDEDLAQLLEDVLSEMKGAHESLKPLVEGRRPRVPLSLRTKRRLRTRREERRAWREGTHDA
jgi:hypothetical protein